MAERHAPRKRNARIVYHVGERTFARIFNESSLEEVKDVVRRKLGLDESTAVTLKQMKHGRLLDLDDDDDFEAFETLLLTIPLDVEIQVTVGGSRPTVATPTRESPPGRVTSALKPSKPTDKQPPIPAEVSTSTAKTPKRKRAVSFGDAIAPEAPKPAEKPSVKKQKIQEKAQAAKPADPTAISPPPVPLPSTVEPPRTETLKAAEESSQKKQKTPAKKTTGVSSTPVAPTFTSQPPRTDEETATTEPVKEKRKKEKKAKEAQSAPVVEVSSKKASDAPQASGSALPATAEREKETETSGSAQPAAKKRSKKKDLPASLDQDALGIDGPVGSAKDNPPQPASKKPRKSTGEGEATKSRKPRKSEDVKPSACASIPPTSESRRLQHEIVDAILSRFHDRSRRQLMKKTEASSDSDTEEEESVSPPPPPAEAMDDDPPTAIDPNQPVDPPVAVRDGDIVMKDAVTDVPVPEKQIDDSGEETQVEREDALVVDADSIGLRAAVADKVTSPATVPLPSPKVPASQSKAALQATVEADTTATVDVPVVADVDPIEPADDMGPPPDFPPPNVDPIEAGSSPPEVGESFFSNFPHSTPKPGLAKRLKTRNGKPGLAKRLKTRNGKIPDSDEHPVSLEQFIEETQDAVSQSQSSQEKERLFDLTPSQVPFPYSQYRDPAPVASFDKAESEETTDSEEEKTLKKKPKVAARKSTAYRSLSQLASQASLFSPSLPTPANTSGSNGKGKKKKVADESSSSSSDSDEEEVNGSGHIPQNRRAGSALAAKKKRKSLLSRV